MSQTVQTWGVEQVIAFLHEISLVKYDKDIKKNKVDGTKLLKATQEKGGSIKGIKSKDDFKKIKECLTAKITAMEYDQTSDSSLETYERPDTPPRRYQRPGSGDDPPAIVPRKGGRGSSNPVAGTGTGPKGFTGKPPPQVPAGIMKPKTSLFGKAQSLPATATPPQKPKRSAPPEQFIPEDVYDELDAVAPNQGTPRGISPEEEDYLLPDFTPPQPQLTEALPQCRAPARPPMMTQTSSPVTSTSTPVHTQGRSHSEKSKGPKMFDINTMAIRNVALRKTSVQEVFAEPPSQQAEEDDLSKLSVIEKAQRLSTGKSPMSSAAFRQPQSPRQFEDARQTQPSRARKMSDTAEAQMHQRDNPASTPRRPPEPLPKRSSKPRDSGVSMTSNFSSNSQHLQQERSPAFPYNRASQVTIDSSFSDSSFGSRGLENSSGITVVTRPKQNTQFHQPSLESLEWFHGHIQDRKIGTAKLQNFAPGQNGVFLVRMSIKKSDQPYVIMVVHENDVKNIPICVRQNKGNKFALGNEKVNEELFDSVEELIQYHRHNEIIVSNQHTGVTGSVTLGMTPPKL